jgi:hypothetical protein
MAERPAYPMLRVNGSSPPAEVAYVVNNAMLGRVNAVIDFDIPASATSVVVEDERLHEFAIVLGGIGSGITAAALASGQVTLTVPSGVARTGRIAVLG